MRSIIVAIAALIHTSAWAQETLRPDSLFFSFPVATVRSDSLVDVIVEFVEEPMFLAVQNKFRSIGPVDPVYSTRFSQFASDIGPLMPPAPGIAAGGPIHQFYKTFFGTAVRLPQGSLAAVRSLPYVKRVHTNARVRTFLDHSVSQVRATDVWSTFGMKGDGVVVGIIDTGVDYLHPALGGGIGPAFKVLGGYDFVNQDDDPMDDEGHGTHVAGIVAADTEGLQGVAPNARLYAFKVLDHEGEGSMADVVAAVERTVDPNDDGDPADRLDIVNMSLGAFGGEPDDAASTAVDNATRLGVTFCIAAGNAGRPTPVEGKDGNYYYDGSESIGSPGSSRLAITVGAVDDADVMADFSSKGPVRISFGIKPDVVAPGVDITSLARTSGTTQLSGTSMATPHVAGVAALVRSMHPDWTPAEIKSAIVATAKDLLSGPMQQGAGRVDAFRAVNVSTMLEPTNLSYGLDDPAVALWVRSETLTVRNARPSSQSYQVAAQPAPAGITVVAVPSSFTLDSSATQSVVVTLSVDNAVVPIIDEDIEIYGGQVYFRGTSDTLHVPWSFVRTSRLLLTFDQPDASFMGGSGSAYFISDYYGWMYKSRRLSPTVQEVIGVPAGTYDVATFFPNVDDTSMIVLREEVAIPTSGGSLQIASTEAVHPVHFNAVDAKGLALTGYQHSMRGLLVHFPNGLWMNNIIPQTSTDVLVSPASVRATLHGVQAVADYSDTRTLLVPQFNSWSGMSGAVTLTNDPSDYVHQSMRFAVPPERTESMIFTELFVMQTTDGVDEGVGNLYLVDTASVENGAVAFDAYIAPEVGTKFSLATSFYVNYSDISSNGIDFTSPYFTARNDSLFNSVEALQDASTYRSADGDTLILNASPAHMEYVPYNNSFGPGSIQFLAVSRGPLGEFRYDDLMTGSYTIENAEGEVVLSASLADDRFPVEVPVGVYTSELTTSNHYINGFKGSVVSRHRYDLSQSFPSPPTTTLFRVLDGRGKLTQLVRHQEQASLHFGFKVIGPGSEFPIADSTKVFYRVHGHQDWTAVDVQKIADLPRPGSYFSADLSPATALDSVAIDLRVASVEVDGNSTELMVLPAFAVGEWDGLVPTEVEEQVHSVPMEYALEQNYPNPFNPETHFELRIANFGLVNVSIFDILGRKVATLVNEEKSPGAYTITWTASDMPSGVYYYRLSAGGYSAVRKMVLLR